jgi:hypothetical protein
MRFCVAVAALVAVVACGDSADPAGAGGGGAGDNSSRFDEGVIDGLLDAGGGGGEGGGDGDGDAGEFADAQVDSSAPEADAANDAGDPDGGGDPDGALPACDDADSDDVCDADDTCPVGVESECDAVIWEIELPQDGHDIAENPTVFSFALVLRDAPNDVIERLDLAIEADGNPYAYDMAEEDVEIVRDFLGEHLSVSAVLGVFSAGESGGFITDTVTSYPTFTPRDAVVRRVSVSGMMMPSGLGSITVLVRGYVEP